MSAKGRYNIQMINELALRYLAAKRALFEKKYSFLNEMQRKSVFTVNGPLLVIAGVTIGGKFGGVIGMFLGVPLVAIFKLVFYDRFISKRLKEKNLQNS